MPGRSEATLFRVLRAGVDEILNLQPRGGMAKPYQVKQVRHVILKYRLARHGER
ncbi:MAG: hypothetical protein Q8N53_20265 [Longimicrobiales bacterium]|nr:hypothetical protein [Longimicrobiales bacterium]